MEDYKSRIYYSIFAILRVIFLFTQVISMKNLFKLLKDWRIFIWVHQCPHLSWLSVTLNRKITVWKLEFLLPMIIITLDPNTHFHIFFSFLVNLLQLRLTTTQAVITQQKLAIHHQLQHSTSGFVTGNGRSSSIWYPKMAGKICLDTNCNQTAV